MQDMYTLLVVAAVLLAFTFVVMGGLQAVKNWVTIGRSRRAIDRDARELN